MITLFGWANIAKQTNKIVIPPYNGWLITFVKCAYAHAH